MGRKPTRNRLPPGVRARHRGDKTYYFLDVGGKPRKEIPLGSDFVEAMRRWAEMSQTVAPVVVTFKDAADRYFGEVLPKKSPRTQIDNKAELAFLLEIFDRPPVELSKIEPVHLTRYIRWRMKKAAEWLREKGREVPPDAGHVRANREVALFSAIFNYARQTGLTSAPNPAQGVRKNKEKGRDVYIEDDVYQAVWKQADQPLRDAMDLAYLTGQRPSDMLKLSERDIRDGALHIQQGKTKGKLRIEITGELSELLARIRARRNGSKVASMSLVVNERGQPLTLAALQGRFEKAREMAGITDIKSFQFRDLRAKAGTDKTDSVGDIRQAQKQLGHSSVTTTERYVRNRRGARVAPTK